MPPCAMKTSTLYLPSMTWPTMFSGDSCNTSPSFGQNVSASANVLLHAAQNFIWSNLRVSPAGGLQKSERRVLGVRPLGEEKSNTAQLACELKAGGEHSLTRSYSMLISHKATKQPPG